MSKSLDRFEHIVRRAQQFTEARTKPLGGLHPFDERNVHPRICDIARDLFDDGHYSQATFEAYKFLDKVVQRHSALTESGCKLMMQAFRGEDPPVQLTPLSSDSERNEQEGFKFLFAGSVLAIRNPRGHEYNIIDSPDKCLDHLTLASMLLRRLEESDLK